LTIEAYFRQIQDAIAICPIVRSSQLMFDKRSSDEGFIRGEIYFVDDSLLHLREFVSVESDIKRLTYAYQYMTAGRALVFRYDNTGHHRKLNLPTYPHHKHDGAEGHVLPSDAPTLSEVLTEIELAIDLGW